MLSSSPGSEPGVPTLQCCRCRCPALPWGAPRERGRSGQEGAMLCSRVSSEVCCRRGAAGVAGETSLPALLLPPA